MPQDAVTWGALVLSLGSILALIKFWMSIGAHLNKADSASAIATAALAKVDLVSSQLHEYKVEVASEFASADDLKDVERRLVTAVDNLGSRFDRMAERLDKFLEVQLSQLSRGDGR